MSHEEQWFDRVLCWRNSPDGEWTAYTLYELGTKYQDAATQAQSSIANLQVQVEAVREELAASKDIVRRLAQGQDPIRCLTEGMSMVLELRQRVAQLEALKLGKEIGACAQCSYCVWEICPQHAPNAIEMKCSNGSTWWIL